MPSVPTPTLYSCCALCPCPTTKPPPTALWLGIGRLPHPPLRPPSVAPIVPVECPPENTQARSKKCCFFGYLMIVGGHNNEKIGLEVSSFEPMRLKTTAPRHHVANWAERHTKRAPILSISVGLCTEVEGQGCWADQRVQAPISPCRRLPQCLSEGIDTAPLDNCL